MPDNNYRYDVTIPIGNVGENFVYRHFQELLLPGETLRSVKTKNEILNETGRHAMDAGGDLFVAVQTPAIYLPNGRTIVAGIPGITDGAIVYTPVEVKTINNFITRNNNDDLPAGTIEIELWEDGMRSRKGWAVRIMGVLNEVRSRLSGSDFIANDSRAQEDLYDDLTSSGTAYRTVFPGYFIFVFITGDQKPFACVVFRNVYDLFDRISKIAQEEYGFTIDSNNWPLRDDATRFIEEHNLMMCRTKNVWHLDFRKFEDLADVYMIDTHLEDIYWNSRYYATFRQVADISVQQQRLDHLHELAGGKKISTNTD